MKLRRLGRLAAGALLVTTLAVTPSAAADRGGQSAAEVSEPERQELLADLQAPSLEDVTLDTVWGDDPRTGEHTIEQVLVGPTGEREPVRAEQLPSLRSAGLESRAAPPVTGDQPWVNLLCAFPDVAERQRDRGYVESLFRGRSPAIGDYWNDVSDGAIDVTDSVATNWRTLPRPRSAYVPEGGNGDLGRLFEDCTRAHDASVDFSRDGNPFVGINMMFNARLGCCAWGGSRSASLDGARRQWRVTWLPPWAFTNHDIIGHEMGHGFGLPHSDNSDGDGNTYDNVWDVMSGGASIKDDRFGRLSTHLLSVHKVQLGWLSGSEILDVRAGQRAGGVVRPTSAGAGRRVVRIRANDATYLVEVRELSGPYERGLPGRGSGDRKAIITRVTDKARVVDADRPADDNTDSEGVQWRPGERFTGPGFVIDFGALTSNGMRVTVRPEGDDPPPPPPPDDDGESARIRDGRANKCLDVFRASRERGTDVIVYSCHGRSNQQWTLTAAGELKVYDDNTCLDVRGGATARGTRVQTWPCNGQDNQKWDLRADGTIRSADSGLCLDAFGSSDRSRVGIWTCHGRANQQWATPLREG